MLQAGTLFGCATVASAADFAQLFGTTDRSPLEYAVGEEMVFDLRTQYFTNAIDGAYVEWERAGDNGNVVTGRCAGTAATIRTSLDRPGFVRILAWLKDAKGKAWLKFEGGAGADVARIRQGVPEPDDFDAFWARQKAALATVPLAAEREEIKSPTPGVKLYKVKLACAGKMPSTGYLSIPEAAEKLPATLEFHGYNASWGGRLRRPPRSVPKDRIQMLVSAHGFDLDSQEKGYYERIQKAASSNGHTHGFDPEQNKNPETSYFLGMVLRDVRACEYVKTLSEWNGRDLTVAGYSQGGMQAIWMGALVPGVSNVSAGIPWNCDMGGSEVKRLRGDWYVKWVPGLGYYDPVNFARRIPRTCTVQIPHAGLCDYVCPPSGVMAFWNNLTCPRRIRWVQNSTHGTEPPYPNDSWEYRADDFLVALPAEKGEPKPPAGDRLAAYVRANWTLAPHDRMAWNVGTSSAHLAKIAEGLGLDPSLAVTPADARRNFAALVTANRDLIPYAQIVYLLEMPRREFAAELKKAGLDASAKPLCPKLHWHP